MYESCQSWRLQAVMIELNNKKYFVINTYFPTDPKNVTGENIELENVLAEIRNLLVSNQFNYVYVVGDINCDFIRNTVHVKTVQEFMNSTNLYSLWSDNPVDFTYSCENGNGDSFFKVLDHILTLTNSKEQIMTSGVLHLVDNMSDHEPIYAVIKVEEDNLGRSEEKTNVKNESIPKQNWKNASCDQKLEYNDVLFQKLLCMNIPD